MLTINKEVKHALENNIPVVALESTIISHGMPYPQNVETALKVEKIIRDGGAIPATIAIMNGELKVGLTPEEIEEFGSAKGVKKVSRRDIPYVIQNKLMGATTVASTMIIAEMAGIKVFVTGGIGGVHRNGEVTMDVSADLQELAQTNVNVVCAGAKAILDLGKTLEYLETFGVPVLGYKTKTLPAFYSRESDFEVDYRMDSASEIADMIYTKDQLGLKGGVLITNPIPEQHEFKKELIDEYIEEALRQADEQGISGKDTTPFLLAKIKELTKGKSLESNIELVFNNARLGSEIAVELCKK